MTRLRLEEFSQDPTLEQGESVEDARGQAAYEEGYAAGWEDAVSAQSEKQGEVASEIARPMPAVPITGPPPVVVESLGAFAETMAGAPLQIRVAPDARTELEDFLVASPGLRIEFVEDPVLTGGQVAITAATREVRIDLDAAVATIRTAIRTFFDMNQKERTDVE